MPSTITMGMNLTTFRMNESYQLFDNNNGTNESYNNNFSTITMGRMNLTNFSTITMGRMNLTNFSTITMGRMNLTNFSTITMGRWDE